MKEPSRLTYSALDLAAQLHHWGQMLGLDFALDLDHQLMPNALQRVPVKQLLVPAAGAAMHLLFGTKASVLREMAVINLLYIPNTNSFS